MNPLLGLRIVVALLASLWMLKVCGVVGFQTDVGTFWAWSQTLANVGFAKFYETTTFCDYQPLYLYVLWFIGKVVAFFRIPYGTYLGFLVLKAPAMLAHAGLAWCLVSKKWLTSDWFARGDDSVRTLLVFTFFAFNPALTHNAAVWGQVDTLFNLLVVAFSISLLSGRLNWAGLLYALLVGMKPHALFFLPMLSLALMREWSRARQFRVLRPFFLYFVATLCCLYAPFWYLRPGAMLHQYSSTLASYNYAVLNAFNAYFLWNMNWYDLGSKVFGQVSMSTCSFVIFGTIVFYLGLTFVMDAKRRGFDKMTNDALLAVGCSFALAAFMFAPKMHERYSMPALGLMLLLAFRNRIFLLAYIVLSLTTYMNQDVVLDHFFGLKRAINGPLPILCSLLNVFVTLLVFWEAQRLAAGRALYGFSQGRDFSGWYAMFLRGLYDLPKFALQRRHVRALVYLFCLGLVLNFYRLGSAGLPTLKPWTSKVKTIKFDGTAEKLMVFGFTDNDGQLTAECPGMAPTKRDYQAYAALNWVTVDLPHGCSAQVSVSWSGYKAIEVAEVYLRRKDAGVSVTAFCDDGVCHPPVEDAWGDEPSFSVQAGSYYVQTIFDEVYYARAIMEHQRGLFPFESTHPPLGKMMGFATSFLMPFSPLQWRFMNALFGAMIPLLIVFFLRQVGASAAAAFMGGALSLLDTMRVSLSRLYTIDMPVAFFILLVLIFTLRYLDDCVKASSTKRRLVDLTLTTIICGLAVATKWNAVFTCAVVGLCCLFGVFVRYRQTKSRTVWYELFMFAVIPPVVYVASYLPYFFILPTGFSLRQVWDSQFSMYAYHANLTATHPFQSRWYAWPFLQTPLWEHSFVSASGVESLVMIGNPVIWFGMIVGFIVLLWRTMSVFTLPVFLTAVMFLLQFLPWIIASRATFIYHFFVPSLFGICLMAQCRDVVKPWYATWYQRAFLLSAFLVFVLFFPLYLGVKVDQAYLNSYLKWFASWYF